MSDIKEEAMEQIFMDDAAFSRGVDFNPQEVLTALAVLIQTRHIREYLLKHDPKALLQARRAAGLTK